MKSCYHVSTRPAAHSENIVRCGNARFTVLTEGLFYPNGTVFRKEDIGQEVALLVCEEGFWILGFVGGGA